VPSYHEALCLEPQEGLSLADIPGIVSIADPELSKVTISMINEVTDSWLDNYFFTVLPLEEAATLGSEFVPDFVALIEEFTTIAKDLENSDRVSDDLAAKLRGALHAIKGNANQLQMVGLGNVTHIAEEILKLSSTSEFSQVNFAKFVSHYIDFINTLVARLQSGLASTFLPLLAHLPPVPVIVPQFLFKAIGVEYKSIKVEQSVHFQAWLLTDCFASFVSHYLANIEQFSQTATGADFFESEVGPVVKKFENYISGLPMLPSDVSEYASDLSVRFNQARVGELPRFRSLLDYLLFATLLRNNISLGLSIDLDLIADAGAEYDIRERKAGVVDNYVTVLSSEVAAISDNLEGLIVWRHQLESELSQSLRRLPSGLTELMTQLDQGLQALQHSTESLRLQPLSKILDSQKPRIAGVAKKLGIPCEINLAPNAVRIDKSALSAVSEAIMHIGNNALSHGYEGASERLAAGKPEQLSISLSGRYSAATNQLQILIEDNGRGIDGNKVYEKFISELPEETRSKYKDLTFDQKVRLIFEDGVSTAEEVSSVSGRGVAMSAVLESIESLGGSIEISTKVGEGTVFLLSLPRLLAFMPVILFHINGVGEFGIPSSHLVSSTRMATPTTIPTFNNEEIPHLDLAKAFGVDSSGFSRADTLDSYIFVSTEEEPSSSSLVAIRVSKVIGTAEVIVKPVYLPIDYVKCVSIKPDGVPIMVFDPVHLPSLLGLLEGHIDG